MKKRKEKGVGVGDKSKDKLAWKHRNVKFKIFPSTGFCTAALSIMLRQKYFTALDYWVQLPPKSNLCMFMHQDLKFTVTDTDCWAQNGSPFCHFQTPIFNTQDQLSWKTAACLLIKKYLSFNSSQWGPWCFSRLVPLNYDTRFKMKYSFNRQKYGRKLSDLYLLVH